MLWKPRAKNQIRDITEPQFLPASVDFETFADATFMQLTMNHVDQMLHNGYFSMGRWLMPDNQKRPRVVVAHVLPGSYTERILERGMVVSTVNGHDVFTLEDLRLHFMPKGPIW